MDERSSNNLRDSRGHSHQKDRSFFSWVKRTDSPWAILPGHANAIMVLSLFGPQRAASGAFNDGCVNEGARQIHRAVPVNGVYVSASHPLRRVVLFLLPGLCDGRLDCLYVEHYIYQRVTKRTKQEVTFFHCRNAIRNGVIRRRRTMFCTKH